MSCRAAMSTSDVVETRASLRSTPSVCGEQAIMDTNEQGWRSIAENPSLPEIHSSLPVPRTPGFLRKLVAFAGPGFLVAVGYMDPGNWATDIAAGSRYNYSLLFVITLSNLLAILLQSLSIKLGIVSGRDLAQACRDHFSRP